MKFINKKLIINIFVLLLLVLPLLSFSAIIECGNGAEPCGYNDFVRTINNIINWVVGSAGVIFTISAIYGGFLYMTSGVKPANKEKAKNILTSTIIGFIFVLCSWLIVFTIIKILVGNTEGDIFRFIGDR